MADTKKLEELIAEKMAAGLSRSVATEVAKEQLAHDDRLEQAEAKAAKTAKTKKATTGSGGESTGGDSKEGASDPAK